MGYVRRTIHRGLLRSVMFTGPPLARRPARSAGRLCAKRIFPIPKTRIRLGLFSEIFRNFKKLHV